MLLLVVHGGSFSCFYLITIFEMITIPILFSRKGPYLPGKIGSMRPILLGGWGQEARKMGPGARTKGAPKIL